MLIGFSQKKFDSCYFSAKPFILKYLYGELLLNLSVSFPFKKKKKKKTMDPPEVTLATYGIEQVLEKGVNEVSPSFTPLQFVSQKLNRMERFSTKYCGKTSPKVKVPGNVTKTVTI